MSNAVSHSNQLDQSVSVMNCWVEFFFISFSLKSNRFAVSDLGLHCLHMFHKTDANFIGLTT